MRDAGSGKVRGPNGRYLPINDGLPAIKKAKKPKKGGRKPGLKATEKSKKRRMSPSVQSGLLTIPGDSLAQKAISEESGVEATEPSSFTNDQSPSPTTPAQESEGNDEIVVLQGTDTVIFPVTNDDEQHVETATNPDTGISAAYLLAAEADPVPSNLDRLPPNSRKAAKRKREQNTPPSARKRGKYGGIVGRPRRTDQPKSPQKQQDAEVEPEPQMQTRRTTRRSAAADLYNTKPTLSSPKRLIESLVRKDDEAVGGVDQYTTADHEPKSGASQLPAPPPAPSFTDLLSPPTTDIDLLNIGLKSTSSPDRQQLATSSTPSAPITTNEKETAYLPGHVELIARITTGNGMMELPISEDQINSDEVKMIRKYAEWNASESAVPVPYAQFRKIFSFAKDS